MARNRLTPSQRSQAARKAALEMHAQGKTNTGPATRASMARFANEVDPDGKLSPAERAKRADAARRAYFAGLALRSSRSRSRRTAS